MNNEPKSLEEAGITIREAAESDLPLVEGFLSRPDIDSLFTPPLSDPARGITIAERVHKKFTEGVWIVSVHNERVVGCLAVVPTKLQMEVPSPQPEKGIHISEGISFADWGAKNLKELSTVVTDRKLRDELGVKGVGAELLNKSKDWVQREGHGEWGFITDSWVGGDMGGFIDVMNGKAHHAWLSKNGRADFPPTVHTLSRIYTDPSKRGVDGPPTVVYGIPIEDKDWEFFAKKQPEINALEERYREIEAGMKQ